MNLSGIGQFPPSRSWGVIKKCPYCEKTNIKRLAKTQITCGKQKCRDARRREKRAGLPVAALPPFEIDFNEVPF